MPVTPRTMELLDGLSIHVDQTLEAVDRAVLAAWARAWTEVAVEWESALADLAAAGEDGAWPSRRQIRRAQRARRALELTYEAVQRAARDMGLTVERALTTFVPAGAEWELALLQSQVPASTARGVQLLSSFDRVDPQALEAIVRRTAAAVTKDAAVLPAFVTTTIQSVLVKGVAVGDNPRAAAAEMLSRLQGSFDLGRTRALVIARTEMLDAHRTAAQAADKANAKALAGWQWVTTLDARTCIGCLAMHGRQYPVDTPGPLGHQQCRCARVPVRKSWADLGFDIPEPPDTLPDAQAWFDALPPATQERIAGKQRLALYLDGHVSWEDLATRRTNPGWRDSFVPTPVSRLAR